MMGPPRAQKVILLVFEIILITSVFSASHVKTTFVPAFTQTFALSKMHYHPSIIPSLDGIIPEGGCRVIGKADC